MSSSGWIRMIGIEGATGALRELYSAMEAGQSSRPAIYHPPSGDVANIVKCHSLDPEGMRLAFGLSGAVHWSPLSLPWAEREMLNTITSKTNHCVY
jgi:hypothetical protein